MKVNWKGSPSTPWDRACSIIEGCEVRLAHEAAVGFPTWMSIILSESMPYAGGIPFVRDHMSKDGFM